MCVCVWRAKSFFGGRSSHQGDNRKQKRNLLFSVFDLFHGNYEGFRSELAPWGCSLRVPVFAMASIIEVSRFCPLFPVLGVVGYWAFGSMLSNVPQGWDGCPPRHRPWKNILLLEALDLAACIA